MVLLSSEICDFGKKPKNFLLKSVNDDFYDWKNVKGKSGTLVCLFVIIVLTLKL